MNTDLPPRSGAFSASFCSLVSATMAGIRRPPGFACPFMQFPLPHSAPEGSVSRHHTNSGAVEHDRSEAFRIICGHITCDDRVHRDISDKLGSGSVSLWVTYTLHSRTLACPLLCTQIQQKYYLFEIMQYKGAVLSAGLHPFIGRYPRHPSLFLIPDAHPLSQTSNHVDRQVQELRTVYW